MSVASENLGVREVATPDVAPAAGVKPPWRITYSWIRFPLMLAVPVVLVLTAGYWYLTGARYVSTDDAYVQADKVMVSADVAGRVVSVEVRNNQQVTAGQILFRLDDRPFRIALERAQAQLATARLQVEALRANYRQKLADLKGADDMAAFQQREYERQQQLVSSHITPQSKFDEARHNLDAARQQLAGTQQQIANIVANLGGDPDIETEKHPTVMQAQAQVDQAELDLSHTIVYAPSNGVVSKVDQLPVGNYLPAAAPAFSLVTTDRAWVEANFKETELTHMLPGQEAKVKIDTYPDHTCTGKVDSISAGAGSEFSVLPAQNASGNWVKVVQRFPVRLNIDCGEGRPLRAGMSADVVVDTKYQHPWLAKLEGVSAGR